MQTPDDSPHGESSLESLSHHSILVCTMLWSHEPAVRRSLQAHAEGMQTPSPHEEPSLESLIHHEDPGHVMDSVVIHNAQDGPPGQQSAFGEPLGAGTTAAALSGQHGPVCILCACSAFSTTMQAMSWTVWSSTIHRMA